MPVHFAQILEFLFLNGDVTSVFQKYIKNKKASYNCGSCMQVQFCTQFSQEIQLGDRFDLHWVHTLFSLLWSIKSTVLSGIVALYWCPVVHMR